MFLFTLLNLKIQNEAQKVEKGKRAPGEVLSTNQTELNGFVEISFCHSWRTLCNYFMTIFVPVSLPSHSSPQTDTNARDFIADNK